MNNLQNVSISHATMRPEDLIPCFISAIREIDTTIENQLSTKLDYIESEAEKDDYYESEDCQYDLEWLFDALDSYSPNGFYFGSHPGDGSDYGFWECEEE
jgi:hypothetical protein